MKDKHIFNEGELNSLFELGEILKKIRCRLLFEGKIKIDKKDKIIFLNIKKKL